MTTNFVRRPLWQISLGIVLTFAIVGSVNTFWGDELLGAATEVRGTSAAATDVPGLPPNKQKKKAPQVQKKKTTVVNVFSTRKVTTDTRNLAPFLEDPFFGRFFGDLGRGPSLPRERQERGQGSGVIVSPDGYILTNHHVVDGGTDIKVALSDKREFTAQVVGVDDKTDLAVLKIEQKELPALSMADSSRVQVGDVVLAVGNPFGVGQTVTMGIVSATGRGGFGIEDYEDFIQTDASINPGNSGGALVNAEGKLIGINTAIISRTGGNQGIGFAIPINMARNVSDQIIRNGKVSRAWLGVMIQPVTPDLAKAFKAPSSEGALISEVTSGSPAERAGLKPGDIVTKVDERSVVDSRSLQLAIGAMAPNATVHLTVFRDGVERTLAVTLGEQESQKISSASGVSGNTPADRALDGVTLEAVAGNAAHQLGKSGGQGVVVSRIDPNSRAAQAGLEQGDVILEVNRQPVSSVDQVRRYIEAGTTDTALIFVNHDGRTRYLGIPVR
jgi:serine protease Do